MLNRFFSFLRYLFGPKKTVEQQLQEVNKKEKLKLVWSKKMTPIVYTLVDQQEMPADVSLPEFLSNISVQLPEDLMIREGDKITLKVELERKK